MLLFITSIFFILQHDLQKENISGYQRGGQIWENIVGK